MINKGKKELRILSVLVHRPGAKEFGGAINAAKNLSRVLASEIKVDFAEMDYENKTEIWADNNAHYFCKSYFGIPEILRKNIGLFQSRIFNAFVFSEIPRVIKEGNYDLVHIHNLHPIWAVYQIARACLLNEIPYVMSCHGIHESYYRNELHSFSGFKSLAVYLGSSIPLRYIYRRSSLIFASSPADYPILDKLSVERNKVIIVPNGYSENISEKVTDSELKQIRNKYGLSGDIPIIFHLGELKYHKGLDLLIKALSSIELDYYLFVAGPIVLEEYKYQIQELISENDLNQHIKILGKISEGEVRKFHHLADIFILPSRFDTFPLAILEAMVANSAVISTDVGGIPYQVDEKTGIVVRSESIPELREAIELLLTDHSLRKSMANSAETRAKKEFSWQSVAQKAITGYLHVVCDLPK